MPNRAISAVRSGRTRGLSSEPYGGFRRGAGGQLLTKVLAAAMPLLSIALFDSMGLGTLPGKTM